MKQTLLLMNGIVLVTSVVFSWYFYRADLVGNSLSHFIPGVILVSLGVYIGHRKKHSPIKGAIIGLIAWVILMATVDFLLIYWVSKYGP